MPVIRPHQSPGHHAMWVRVPRTDLDARCSAVLGLYSFLPPGQDWGRGWAPPDPGFATLPFLDVCSQFCSLQGVFRASCICCSFVFYVISRRFLPCLHILPSFSQDPVVLLQIFSLLKSSLSSSFLLLSPVSIFITIALNSL